MKYTDFEKEVQKEIEDIKKGGFIIDDWDIDFDGEYYFVLILKGYSGKKYKVIAVLESIDQED